MKLDEAARGAVTKGGEAVTRQVDELRDRRRRARRRLEEIFSRDVLGSVLVSLAAGKMVEQVVVILAPGRPLRFVAWTVAFALFVWLFIYWEHVAARATAAAEAAESATQSE